MNLRLRRKHWFFRIFWLRFDNNQLEYNRMHTRIFYRWFYIYIWWLFKH